VLVCLRGHLGQVGYAQDLVVFAQCLELLADGLCDGAPYTGVDFIEYQGRYTGGGSCRDLDCQTDAGQFAAGSHFCERSGRLSGVGADQEFDAVAAVRGYALVPGIGDFNDEVS